MFSPEANTSSAMEIRVYMTFSSRQTLLASNFSFTLFDVNVLFCNCSKYLFRHSHTPHVYMCVYSHKVARKYLAVRAKNKKEKNISLSRLSFQMAFCN